LNRQAAFLNGTTERLFRAAGLEPGMRVLDVGTGEREDGPVAVLDWQRRITSTMRCFLTLFLPRLVPRGQRTGIGQHRLRAGYA
jgi:hypothetical protein